MVVVVDSTNAPWIHASGTTAEVLGHLKAQHIPQHRVSVFYNGTNTSAVYHKGV